MASVRNAWCELMSSSGHLRLMASAVALGVFAEDDDENEEAIFEKAWRNDKLKGSATANEDGEMPWQVLEREWREAVEEKLEDAELDDHVRAMAEHPEEHLEILRLWAKVEWVRTGWTFQRLFSRALARERFIQFFEGLDELEDQVRVRGYLNSLSTIPHVAIPFAPWRTLTDAHYSWIVNVRVGREPPAVALVAGTRCTCARAPLITARHARMCPKGGGPNSVHNGWSGRVHACCVCAGVSARMEVAQLLPDGDERPGDVVASGIGRGGGDLCIDVTCVDAMTGWDDACDAEREKRARVSGRAASLAERDKRNKRGGLNGERMEDRVAEQGMEFMAVGAETTGATTSACAKLLKTLSEIAHQRRGHNVKAFKRRWTIDWGMALAKKGASVAVARAAAVVGDRKGYTQRGGALGQMLSEDAEPFALEVGRDAAGGG